MSSEVNNNQGKVFRMGLDLNVLNHLGMNLYSSIPAVLSEVVANAWDADATEVKINIDAENDTITIKDNGHGMSYEDLNNKYLTIGYARRKHGGGKSKELKRVVMGRKGIGKLSLFSISEKIDLYSTDGEQKNAFRMDAQEIRRQIEEENQREYNPEIISTDPIDFDKGTKLIIRSLKKKLHLTESALRRRLARRFSIIGKDDFEIILNGTPISVSDRSYYNKIEYIWYYGEESKSIADLSVNKKEEEKRDNDIEGFGKVTGWLALAEHSGSLQESDDDNLNKVVLVIRGKVAQEDLLKHFREGGLYTKFLFGEIRADFLDDDDKPDIATSSRQDVFETDDRYIKLRHFLQNELKHIQRKRAEYKSEQAMNDIFQYDSIKGWYDQLGRDTRNKAKKFFGKLNQIITDPQHKRQMYSQGVLAFESLKYKDSLDALDSVSNQNLEEFLTIFKTFDEIDATLYYKITNERLRIIETLKNHVHDEDSLEKILQEHLFNSLWILDPSWDRGTSSPYMEQRVETEFGSIDANLTDEERNGRLDIKYKTPAGKHVIIELKRASVKTSSYKLQPQVDKYRSGLRKILKSIEGDKTPIIEAICVVGKELSDRSTPEEYEETTKSMAAKNTRVVTYQQLIENAYRAYKAYTEENIKTGELLNLIKKIEEDLTEESNG